MTQAGPKDADTLTVRGGGCIFIAVGLFLGVGSLGAYASSPDRSLLGFHIVLAVFGFALAFGRKVVSVDRSRKVLRVRHGAFGIGRVVDHPLDELRGVTITPEKRSNHKMGHTTEYPVRVLRKDGTAVLIGAPDGPSEARTLGEVVARAIRQPLSDSSSGTVVTREPSELDEAGR